MKKIFTLAIAALAAISVNAQSVTKQALAFTGNTWNVSVQAKSNVGLTSNAAWGEYKLTADPVDPKQYKSIKIKYHDLVAGSDDGAYQTKFEGEGEGIYVSLDPEATELNVEIDTLANPLTTVELQAKSAGSYVLIDGAYLVANDGTETQLVMAGAVWGIDVDPLSTPTLSFTGQYGGQELVLAEDGSHITYDPATEADVEKVVVITASKPTTTAFTFESQNGGAGFAWTNLDAGLTVLTDTLNAKTAVDDKGAAKAVDQVWIKANAADGYPSEIAVTGAFLVTGSHEAIVNAIEGIKADAKTLNVNAPMYNLAGQMVNKSYKGVVIQNGKKFINK